MVRCALCATTHGRFFRVNHTVHGVVILCDSCVEKERENINFNSKTSRCGCW
jgi:hypothetical protein